jgi:hypothetical protein
VPRAIPAEGEAKLLFGRREQQQKQSLHVSSSSSADRRKTRDVRVFVANVGLSVFLSAIGES